MSTTSTRSGKYRTTGRRESQISNEYNDRHSPGGSYRLGQRPSQRKNQRNDDQFIDELSSFVAEYSYSNGKGPERDKQRFYQVYPAQQAGINNPVFGKAYNEEIYENSGPHQGSRSRNKTVGWRDRKKSPSFHEDSDYVYDSLDGARDYRQSDDERKIEKTLSKKKTKWWKKDKTKERNSRSQEKNDLLGNRFKRASRKNSQTSRKKSRSKSRSWSRSRDKQAKKRDNSIFTKRKSKSDYRSRRVKRLSSEDSVKYIPLKYKKRKNVPRKIITKRRPIIRILEPQLRETSTGTVITLYPENKKDCAIQTNGKEDYTTQSHDRKDLAWPIKTYDTAFLTNSKLPCKCFKCKKKFEELVKIEALSHIPKIVVNSGPKGCDRYLQPPKHDRPYHERPYIFHPRPRIAYIPHFNCWSCEDFGECNDFCRENWICRPPCRAASQNNCFTPLCQQECISYHNSLYWKLNCYRQSIDPDITEYFHSILNKFG